MKKFLEVMMLFLIAFGVVMVLFSCDIKTSKTADQLQSQKTLESMSEMDREVGMPAIHNFQEKKVFKQILEARDQADLITYCYFFNEMNGKIGQFLGKGIGYGVPAATQFTNPTRTVKYFSAGLEQLPQPDPNGLFNPTSTSATWYMLINEDTGEAEPVYIEPLIIVSPIKLH